MCVFTKRIERAATFLLFVLFGVAGMFFLLDYTYLGAALRFLYMPVLTMLYVFLIQLVSKRTLQGLLEHVKGSKVVESRTRLPRWFRNLGSHRVEESLIDMAATVADNRVCQWTR